MGGGEVGIGAEGGPIIPDGLFVMALLVQKSGLVVEGAGASSDEHGEGAKGSEKQEPEADPLRNAEADESESEARGAAFKRH